MRERPPCNSCMKILVGSTSSKNVVLEYYVYECTPGTGFGIVNMVHLGRALEVGGGVNFFVCYAFFRILPSALVLVLCHVLLHHHAQRLQDNVEVAIMQCARRQHGHRRRGAQL